MKYLLCGLSTRCIAESAVNAGKDVVSVDFFGDLDLVEICQSVSLKRKYGVGLNFNPFLFLRASRDLVYDGVVYGAPLENYPGILERFAQQYALIGNDADVVRNVRDWRNVYSFCKRNRILYPETLDGLDYVVKPKKSGGGVGIQRVSRYVVQRFVEGGHYSASFLGDGEKSVVLSVNEQLIGKKEFGARKFWYCGNVTPVFVDDEKIEEICEKLVKEFGLKGSCGIDLVANDDLYLMEVNPRPQATLEIVEKSLRVNMFVLHEQACNNILENPKNSRKTWGKAIVYTEEDVIMPDTRTWLDYGWVKDVPHSFERIKKGEPVCTVIADGSDRDDCVDHLVKRAESIKLEIKR
ncbi:MAG: ATP-grasp domain-containing protein [Theionarchaea archaeon]|nr:ATP-grasp domain-containing protein [Theionarchaea archaeon]